MVALAVRVWAVVVAVVDIAVITIMVRIWTRAAEGIPTYLLLISPDYSGGGGSSFRDTSSRREFDEYDAGEFEEGASSPRAPARQSSVRATPPRVTASTPSAPPKPTPAPKETDLLGGFGDDEVDATAPPAPAKPLPTLTANVSLDGKL